MDTKLFHYIIQMPTAETSKAYRLLESHEGIAFYTTLDPDPLAHGPRETRLELQASATLAPEFQYLIDLIKTHCQAQIVYAQLEEDR
ncbi:MAG: hypothetical protein J6Y94_00535 [Bacteriovoracaceae bacterium]|nr:hypothetical protein [Bacteriovoracaceae bacterium]